MKTVVTLGGHAVMNDREVWITMAQDRMQDFRSLQGAGLEALSDRSRRPVHYANQLPARIEILNVKLKAEKPHCGARKIRELLGRRPRWRCWRALPLFRSGSAIRASRFREALDKPAKMLAITAFERLFRERGLPLANRSDNGGCSSLQGAVIVSIRSLSGNGGSRASLVRIRRPAAPP